MEQAKKLVPKRRFKGFTDGWEKRKLSELSSLITKGTTPLDRTGKGDVNFIKVENINHSSGEINNFTKISSEEHLNYLKRSQLKEDDILFSIAGTLGRVTSVKADILPANTNQALAIIRLKTGILDYIKTYLKGKAVSDFIKENPTIGAQPNLSLEQVSNLEIAIPTKEEQEKIGKHFFNLDNLITLHQRKLDKIKSMKKAYLSEMFPAEGETKPKRRFKGFTDDWEQLKIGEIGSVQTCKRIFKEQTSISGDIPFYKNGTLGLPADSYISKDVFDKFKKLYPFPEVGDILMSVVGSIGRTVEYMGDDEYFQDSNIVWLKTNKSKINRKFLKISYQIIDWIIEGSTIKHLYNDNILLSKIWVPSISEQEQIGGFFINLDNLITLHQQKLDKLKNLKKSYLNEMFI